jgi:hypothetical protein
MIIWMISAGLRCRPTRSTAKSGAAALAPRRFILAAVAALDVAAGLSCHAATAQTLISNAREVRDALRACWVAPENGPPRQISVRSSFSRDGRVVGQPVITYQNPAPSEAGRAAVREALSQAIGRCERLPLSDDFRKVISVRPITVRLGCGWGRRGMPQGDCEGRTAPAR